MTTDNPFSRDVRVRRAMQMALDLETMNNTYFRGTAKWKPRGVLGDAIVGYNTPFEEWPEEVRKGYMYDPEGAEKLLDEAGYPRGADGIRIKATEHHFEHSDFDYAQLAASYWKAIGVDVEIIKLEAATHGALRRERTYGDMISWISGIDYLEPLTPIGWVTRRYLTQQATTIRNMTACMKPPETQLPLRSSRGRLKRQICTLQRTTSLYGVLMLQSLTRSSHGLVVMRVNNRWEWMTAW